VVSEPLRVKHLLFGRDKDGKVLSSTLKLPKRKADQLGERCDIVMGCTGDRIVCSTNRLNDMLAARQSAGEVITEESFLFATQDAVSGDLRPVTYDDLMTMLRADLRAIGVNADHYAGHSFRIGGCTTLAQNNCPSPLVEAVGGWVPGSRSMPLYNRSRVTEISRVQVAEFFTKNYLKEANEVVDQFAWSESAEV
jgi:hypothetical protein